jgi:hypothetical protein
LLLFSLPYFVIYRTVFLLAALLQETTGNPHFENMADFEEKRRSYHKQQRESQKTALELLHHYRADDQVVLHSKEATTPERMHRAGSKKNNRRSTGASTPDAIASVYLSPQQSYELPGDRQTFSAYDDVSFHHPAHPDAFASVYQSPIQPFDLPPDSKREEEDNARASPNTLSSTIPMTSLMNVARNLSLYDVVEDQVDNIRKEEDATTATISPVLLFGPVILPTTTRSSDDHSGKTTMTTRRGPPRIRMFLLLRPIRSTHHVVVVTPFIHISCRYKNDENKNKADNSHNSNYISRWQVLDGASHFNYSNNNNNSNQESTI